IHVASTLPAEGKTTVALCAAASAAVAGQRAVVIDCNLRDAALSRRLGLLGRAGITGHVHGESSGAEGISFNDQMRIAAIPVGTGSIDPQHTLSSPRMQELITELRKSFEFIVIDSAPLDAVLDGALVASLADTTLLVIRWNATAPALIGHALSR